MPQPASIDLEGNPFEHSIDLEGNPWTHSVVTQRTLPAPRRPTNVEQAGGQIEPFDWTKLIPAGAGILGEAIGGPIGGATLTGLSEYALHPESPGSALLAAGLQSIPTSGSTLKKTLAKGTMRGIGIAPAGQLPEDLAGLAAHPELKPTVAQAAESSQPGGVAKWIESTLSRGAKLARERKQQQTLVPNLIEEARQKVTGIPTPKGAFTIGEKAAPLRSAEDKAFDVVRQNAANNTQTFQVKVGEHPSNVVGANGQPIMIPDYVNKDVIGPVHLNNSAAFADQLKPEIDALLADLPKSVEPGAFIKLRDTLGKITNPSVITDQGQRIVPFDTVKELRTEIGEIVQNKALRDTYQSRQTGGLSKLRSLLGDDLQDSISHQWTNDPGPALVALNNANSLTKQRYKANAVDNLVRDSTDQANKSFNPDTFINNMKDEKSWYYDALGNQNRGDLEQVMRAIRAVQPAGQSGMLKSLGVHAGLFTLGAVGGLLEGHLPMGSSLGLTAMIGAHQFASKVLLDPKYARLAAKLPSLPTDSFEASTITKTLLKAMKGSAVYLVTPSGGKIQATIDEKGIPKPDFNLGASSSPPAQQ
jgi:hypothetical protein